VDSKNTAKILCVHPHGVFAMGWGILFSRPELESVGFCFSQALYNSPFFRLMTKTIGRPAPADKVSFLRMLSERRTLAIIPGGFEEATIHCAGEHRVYCRRQGLVKYALEHGYSLVPCYCFGENKTYSNVQGAWSVRLWLNSFGIPGVLACGKWWCPLLPRNEDMHIVVGKGLVLPRIENPSPETVEKHHAMYVQALVDLFDRHKADYGEARSKLVVW